MHNSFAKKNGKIRAASLQQLIVRLKLDAHEVNRNIKTKGESGDFNSKLTTEWRTSSQLGRARAGRWPRSSTIKKIRPLRYGKWLGVPPLVTTSQMGCVVSDNTFCRFQFWLIGESKIFFSLSLSLFFSAIGFFTCSVERKWTWLEYFMFVGNFFGCLHYIVMNIKLYIWTTMFLGFWYALVFCVW